MAARLPILVILAAAGALRLWGIDFGLPHTLGRPDEDAVMAIAGRCFRRQLNPEFFDWPTLFMYSVCAGHVAYFNVGRLLGWFPTEYSFLVAGVLDASPLFLIARGLSVAAGVATVWTVSRIGTVLFDRTTGLVAAALLAVAALAVRDSHFGVPDTLATWLVAQSFLHVAISARTGARRNILRAAVWAGLATSAKYNAALVLVPGVWLIARGGLPAARQPRERIALVALYGALAVGVFLLGTPYALLDWRAFLPALASISAHLRGGHAAVEGYGWTIHLTSSLALGLGWPLLLAGIAGLATGVVRDRRSAVLLALFPVLYYLGIGAGRTTFARYILPVVPFLCLGAANLITDAGGRLAERYSRITWRPVLAAVLAAVVASPSAWSVVQTNRLLTRPDSRLLAARWIQERFPNGATIYQTGSSYSQVQMRTADARAADRYAPLTFDPGSGLFRSSDEKAGALPDVIVRPRCPLVYCAVPRELEPVLARAYESRQVFTTIDDSSPAPIFDRDDAFFVPLARFGGMVRPGPTVEIYVRKGV